MDFDALIARFRAPLVGFFAGQGAPWGEAIELAQDVFVAAYLGTASFRGSSDDRAAIGRWLRGIARNTLRARARRRRRERLEPTELDHIPHAAPERSDDSERLRRAIAALPESLRTVVYMHHLDEVAVGDVAALLGISARAVEGRLYRARARLGSALRRPAGARPAGTRPANSLPASADGGPR